MLLLLLLAAVAVTRGPMPARAASPDHPPDFEAYHTFREMVTEIKQAAIDHPAIVQLSSIGRSYEGRNIWMAKVSDNVALDEDEPEIMFDALIHAREHMGAEMALVLFGTLTDHYGAASQLGQRVTEIVDSREIFIVFMANPDGEVYDTVSGAYRFWRKNRQPTPGSSAIGTDVNRNFSFQWGRSPGSSGIRTASPIAA